MKLIRSSYHVSFGKSRYPEVPIGYRGDVRGDVLDCTNRIGRWAATPHPHRPSNIRLLWTRSGVVCVSQVCLQMVRGPPQSLGM